MSIHHDSELIEQVVTSTPLLDTQDFYVVKDEKQNPMVFSIGTHGVLYLIKQDELGRNQLINLSEKLSIPAEHEATALGVYQDTDLTLNLVFAHGEPKGLSQLVVLRRLKPEAFDKDIDKLLDHAVQGQDNTIQGQIYGLLIGRGSDDDHPLAVARFRKVDSPENDICRLDIDYKASSWSVKTDLEMPCNPRQIISLCPGTLPGGGGTFGVFVLFRISEVLRLSFTGLGGQSVEGYYSHVNYHLPVPPGASDLATVRTSMGRTDLLVSAENGIHRIPARDCARGSTKLPDTSLVASADCLRGLKQIHAAQSGSLISVFTRNNDGVIAYTQFKIGPSESPAVDAFERHSDANQVLDGGVRFAASVNETTQSQQMFVLGDEDHPRMRVLYQSGDSSLWTTGDFSVPAIKTHREVFTYTTHIKIYPGAGGRSPADGLEVDLSASSTCLATVNGRTIELSRLPVKVKADVMGTLTVIQEIDDLNVPSLRVSGVPGCETTYIDPSRKVLDFFSKIKSGDDLQNAHLPNGEKLLSGGSKNVNIEGAAAAIKSLSSKGASMKLEAQFTGTEKNQPVSLEQPSEQPKLGEESNISGEKPTTGSWAVFDWLTRSLESVRDIFVDGWHLVVKIGKKVWKFLVQTYEHVMKGLRKALEWLGEGLKKIWNGLKFLFAWGDIKETHNIFRDYFEGFVDTAVKAVLLFGDKAVSYLDELEESLSKNCNTTQLPPEVDRPVDHDGNGQKGKEPSQMEKAFHSPGGNYANHHAQHNPEVRQAMESAKKKIEDDDLTKIVAALEDLVKEFAEGAGDIGSALVSLLDPSRKATVSEVFSQLGSKLLTRLIAIARDLITLFVQVGAKLILMVKSLATATIDIPVISWLWSKISDRPLSFLDAITMLLAIPGTIAFKICHGVSPKQHPSFKEIQAAKTELDAELVGHELMAAPQLFAVVQPTASETSDSGVASKEEKPKDPSPGDGKNQQTFVSKIMKHSLLQKIAKWLKAHSYIVGIIYFGYSCYSLFSEAKEWLTPMGSAFPNFGALKEWDKGGAAKFLFSLVLSFPTPDPDDPSPSWGLQLTGWVVSIFAGIKHCSLRIFKGMVTMFFSALQAVIYAGCVTWDHVAGYSKADGALKISNTCLAKGHDFLSGLATYQPGNYYVMGGAAAVGLTSIVVGSIIKAQDAEVKIAEFIFQT
ncbi:hypothetical protein B0H65DRAFT_566621 [Neurospora tetraspora]|uniref:Uncharacterized protein n=1 Tax=Neurospora tetraspora TaxID=94610 RepID=A0AAE0J010_9PEZI|nr:hypothetical protein B0H65DRAFT_566621 [Neurospora tetraspora]